MPLISHLNMILFTDSLNRQYGGESRLGTILGIFTGLAFFVSCLGLFGLALIHLSNVKKRSDSEK